MHQEPENKNAAQASGGEFREIIFGTCVPHIERRIAQGTVALSRPVAGPGLLRAAPDAELMIAPGARGSLAHPARRGQADDSAWPKGRCSPRRFALADLLDNSLNAGRDTDGIANLPVRLGGLYELCHLRVI